MKFFLRKLVRLLIVLFVVTFITFVSVRWLPGDPIAIKTGGGATKAQVAELRSYYGFDKPVFTQYWVWLGRAVTGDLGESVINPIKITTTLKHTLPISLTLMVWAQFLALLIAIPLGILTAYRAGTAADRAINTASFGLLSIPEYVYAPLFVILIAVPTRKFPAVSTYYALWDRPGLHFKNMFLPALTLAMVQIPVYMRLLRTDMVATLQMDFITMARAKGLSTKRILFRHALRPSSFSLLTVAAVNIGALIGGSFVVENFFNLNGLGKTTINAVVTSDYTLVQGVVLVVAVGFVVSNFLVDLSYSALDPRIKDARALA